MAKKRRAKVPRDVTVATVGPAPRSRLERWGIGLFRFLSSLRLAVILLSILAMALAIGTVWESRYGTKAVQLDIYKRFAYLVWIPPGSESLSLPVVLPGFCTLLLMLGVVIFCAAMSRYPWKRHHTGFVITHSGLLVLLTGSLVSYQATIEGQLHIPEGAEGDSLLLVDDEVVRFRYFDPHTRGSMMAPSETVTVPFFPGPRAWPVGRKQGLRTERSNVRAEVTGFLPSTSLERKLVDEPGGDPLVRLVLHGAPNVAGVQREQASPQESEIHLFLNQNGLFVDQPLGPAAILYWRLSEPTELKDLLDPPSDLPESGVLHVHYRGKMHPIPVEGNVANRVPLPDSDASVEIVEYRTSLAPTGNNEESGDEEKGLPLNPVLRVRFYSPQGQEDHFVLARSSHYPTERDALMTLVHSDSGRRLWPPSSPVKFWFHHPAVQRDSSSRLEVVQTPTQELYFRIIERGKLLGKGKIEPGKDYPCWMEMKFRLADFRRSVRVQHNVVPAPRRQGQDSVSGIRMALRLGRGSGAQRHEFWLQKTGSSRHFVTPDRQVLEVSYDTKRYKLGYSLHLKDFEVGFDPGTTKAATYTSVVTLHDPELDLDEEQVITMNEPLIHGPAHNFAGSVERATAPVYRHWLFGIPLRAFVRSGRGFTDLTFYQSSYYPNSDGTMTSVFAVAKDPGYAIKMVGCAMIVGGIWTMFYMRAYFFKPRGSAKGQRDPKAARQDLKKAQSKAEPVHTPA